MRSCFIFALFLLSLSCGNPPAVSNNATPNTNAAKTTTPVVMYDYEILKTYTHDPKAFTQGLEFHDGVLYEGTGGKDDDPFFSSLRKVELATGKVLQKHDVPREYFGEGITILNDKVYQLTWRQMTAFEYDLKDFKLLRELRYTGEGWGLTNDGTNLIMSDGTHVIRFVNPEDFKTVRTIVVNDEKGKPVMELNELEYVKGEIWANIWQTGWIVRIDPATGKLLGRIDMNKLSDEEQQQNPNADVLNGIAYDAASDKLYVTGKLWRRLFEIKVNPR
ncbi:MAG: glutamine cyclotransferase [Acidobacteria bacterium]|nr:MAG: glutamine cyclotransferase [Acidobacteriota bacterium]